jgi:hypothetical protein
VLPAVHLHLWTFQRNAQARRFYEARGFALVEETDGAGNEEKEPDALYLWKLVGGFLSLETSRWLRAAIPATGSAVRRPPRRNPPTVRAGALVTAKGGGLWIKPV